MHLHRLIAFIRRILGREQALARCPVASQRRIGLLLVVGIALCAAPPSFASVLVTGDVTPADNPFPNPFPNGPNENEGLPPDGNFINPFEAPDEQTFFEGRHVDNVLADLTDDDNVLIDEIVVGETAFGTLLISGESALRDGHLTIGASGLRTGGTFIRAGTGVVRITGFGSLYNNDPTIIPPGLPPNFSSKTPRPLDEGYDLIIGSTGTVTLPGATGDIGGTGTLEISAGGRAEIQDAVVVGASPSSTGSIIVDGFDSFLGSGGFEESVSMEDPHEMLIGDQGVGYMTITNGGTVRSDSPGSPGGSGGSIGPIGAVIGGSPFSLTEGQAPDPGGVGSRHREWNCLEVDRRRIAANRRLRYWRDGNCR